MFNKIILFVKNTTEVESKKASLVNTIITLESRIYGFKSKSEREQRIEVLESKSTEVLEAMVKELRFIDDCMLKSFA